MQVELKAIASVKKTLNNLLNNKGIQKKVLDRVRSASRTLAVSSMTRPAAILTYHRINVPTNPVNNLAVSVESFREQMRVVREHFEPVSLQSFIDSRSAGLFGDRPAKRRVIVTFDDGYADTLLNALPVLEEFNIPATVFVTTGMIEKQAEFWWDEVEELVIEKIPAKLLTKIKTLPASIVPKRATKASREQLFTDVCAHLKASPRAVIERSMAELRELAGVPPLARDPQRAMTIEELKKLAQHPLIEIGGHTVTHPSLGRLDYGKQYEELKASKDFLEQTLGRPVKTLAYPFGGEKDFNATTQVVARQLGYQAGLTTVSGVASTLSNPYAMPRMFVKDWAGADFNRRLSRFFWIG